MLAIGWVYFWSCPSLAGHFNLNFGQFFVFNKYSPCFHSRKHANTNKSCHVQSSTQYLSTCPWIKKQPSKRFVTFQHLPTSFWWEEGGNSRSDPSRSFLKPILQIHGIWGYTPAPCRGTIIPLMQGLLISSGAFFPWKSHRQCTCNQSGTSEASGSSFLAFANNKRIQVVRKKFENLLFCVVRWVLE